LGAFACNQRYFIVKSTQDIEFLEENIFSKGI
jgi:UDP-2,3-diacylglucosamine hydrolase